jgi:hypothetical protein
MAVSRINEAGLNVNQYGNRNILINGAAQVYQRGSGAIVQSGSVYGVDKFRFSTANMDNLAGTFTQDADSPDGFGNSMKATITTAESAIASDEYAYIAQLVEAQNVQNLAYGSSAAKQVTLSFYVKSSVTGTFAVGLYKPDNTAQIHNLTYTINSASTWEYKTLTFAANTTAGGVINDDNGIGFYVNWHLASGADYKGGGSTSGWSAYANNKWADGQATDAVITTTNATFQLTGCQLEVGDTATDFEHRTFADELQKCERYYQRIVKHGDGSGGSNTILGGSAVMYSSSYLSVVVTYRTTMRSPPTLVSANSVGCFKLYRNNSNDVFDDFTQAGARSPYAIEMYNTSDVSGTAGHGGFIETVNSNAEVHLDAEL